MTPKFAIGDVVWRATWDSSQSYVTCPDCGGTKHIRCILFDDTEVTIDCEGCKRGYEPPSGLVPVYDRAPRADQVAISGVMIEDGKVQYNTSAGWHVDEGDLFQREADALDRAREIAAKHDEEERARIAQKEKPMRSWSWHVHYHRREIRDAEKRIAYHSERLAAARVKAKEPAA